FLHYVQGEDVLPSAGDKLDKIQVVNAIATDHDFEALVVARPEHLADSALTTLDLPAALQADVARAK
ncbi:MAG: folate-binding Fe/S cluster repair protein, partial [Psychrobacter sp.]